MGAAVTAVGGAAGSGAGRHAHPRAQERHQHPLSYAAASRARTRNSPEAAERFFQDIYSHHITIVWKTVHAFATTKRGDLETKDAVLDAVADRVG